MDFPRDPTQPTLTECVECVYRDAMVRIDTLDAGKRREAIRALAVRLLEESQSMSEPP